MNKSAVSNLIYLLLAVVFLTIGVYFQKRELNSGLIITEYIIVLLPAFVFANKFKAGKLKEFLRLNKVSFRKIVISIMITLCTYPIAIFGNLMIIALLNYFGKSNIPHVPFASNYSQYLWFLFLMGVTPGICEETLFRGFFLRMNENMGYKKSIIYTAFLFALFHFNLYNFMGPFVLGIVFGYMSIITNSIYPSMICHALNNSIATSIGYFAFKKLGDIPQNNYNLPNEIILFQLIFFAIISVVSFFIIKNLFKEIKDADFVYKEKNNEKNEIYFYGPILICVIIYIILFSRFK